MKLEKYSVGMGDRFLHCSDFFTIDVGDAIAEPASSADIAAFVETRGPDFIPEVSMDETDNPQTPLELFFILAAITDEGISAQTIAIAISEFGLPENLKLSIHSGSDKFSIYGPIRDALRRTGAGVHVKTAGTTWLEELIGLVEGGGEGLEIAREVYAKSLENKEALCKPYATVIDINDALLPAAETVNAWTGEEYARALRHNAADPLYNLHLRQLLHVGYKVAAQMGDRYYAALKKYEPDVSRNVTENLWERHIKPLFID